MWQSVKGRFISVIGANISCACAKSPEGLSPSAHLADGCMDLILVKHTSRFQYLKHMLRITSKADQVSTDHFFILRFLFPKVSPLLFRSASFATLDTRRELGPGNFSGPKSNIQIEIKRIRARVLASKLPHLVSLTDSFITLDAKLLKPRSLM